MELIHTLRDFSKIAKDQPLSIALGVFDGVHLGHQAVIKQAIDFQKESHACENKKALSAVVTFEPHPIQVLAPQKAPKRILANLEHKTHLIKSLGVDILCVINFTKEFALIEAEEFANQLLTCSKNLKRLAVGMDWRFGHNRRGSIEMLRELGTTYSVEIIAHQFVTHENKKISSTRIREAISQGNFELAKTMLGRDYTLWGHVIEGQKLGRQLGFPTANLSVLNEELPPTGVYAVKSLIRGKWLRGIGNLGLRPTVTTGTLLRQLEIHLFDWSGDIYGELIEVQFGAFLREEKRFASLNALKKQIQHDVDLAKNHNWS